MRKLCTVALVFALAGCAPVQCRGPSIDPGGLEWTGPGRWSGPPERVVVRRGGRNERWHRRSHRREGRRGGRRVVVHKYRFLPETVGAGLVASQVADIPAEQWLEELPKDAQVISQDVSP